LRLNKEKKPEPSWGQVLSSFLIVICLKMVLRAIKLRFQLLRMRNFNCFLCNIGVSAVEICYNWVFWQISRYFYSVLQTNSVAIAASSQIQAVIRTIIRQDRRLVKRFWPCDYQQVHFNRNCTAVEGDSSTVTRTVWVRQYLSVALHRG